ncbi:MAG: PQQ-dependent sugar dehydrogenase, partial [Nitrosopumilus sp.]
MRLRRRNLIALMIASSIAAIPLYLGARNPRSNQVADQRQALIVPKKNEMTIDTIVERVEIPWSIAFAPDGRMFFTERRGRLRVVEDGTLLATPFATPEVSAIGEGGLLGVALDPKFDENSLVFAYHTYTEGRKIFNRIVRFKDVGNEGVEQRTIIDQIPGGRNHNGGRIKFGPDGKLYVGTGEAGRRELAQDLSSLGGKILRINPDGSVPDDN